MKNKILPYLFIVALFISISSSYVLADADLSITPEEKDLTKDETFIISVYIDSTEEVFALELDISFDDDVLEVISVEDGGFLSSDGSEIINATTINNGIITYLISRINTNVGISGQGNLVNITFKAKVKNGVSDIILNNIKLSDNNTGSIDHNITNNGIVNVITIENVLINEFMPEPSSGYEWVELYNNNTKAISLSGWSLNDSTSKMEDIPDTVLDVGGLFLIDINPDRLNSGSDDTIKLINDEGLVINEYSYDKDNVSIDVSIGRMHDGLDTWVTFDDPTPNLPNNRLPKGDIIDKEINEDESGYFIVTDEITDPDNDPLTFTIVDDNEVVCNIIDSTNVTLTPLAADWNGIANCTIEVDDSYGKINKSFNINVNPVNDQPYFDHALENQPIDEDSTLTYDINASDIDEEDVLSFISNITTLGGTIDNEGILTWTPDNDDVGEHNIEVEVCDDSGADNNCVSDSLTITVSNTNDAPYFDPALEDQPAYEDSTLTYDIDATDDDGDDLSFTSNITIVGGEINDSTGILTWTPDNDDVGTHNIEVTVCDNTGEANNCTTDNFTITVINTNDQPYFDHALENQPIDEDSTLTYDINASDIDEEDVLSFTSNITTLGGTIDNEGILTWTPDNDDVGTHNIQVTVCDDSGADNNCVSDNFKITVSNVNDAPVIDPEISPINFLEGESKTINLNDYVDDVDNLDEEITWSRTLPQNIIVDIDNDAKTMQIFAPPTWYGSETFTLTANDGALTDNEDNEDVTVNIQSILSFSKLVITIDGNDNPANNLDTVGPASPDSTVSLSVEINNNYKQIEEWVETIVLTGRMDSTIDDETEISLPFTLDGSKSATKELTFKNLPLIIEEGNYDLTLTATGTDYKGVVREISWLVYIDYITENREVRITETTLTDELRCYRSTDLDISLVNTGETLQYVNLTVSNNDLGIYESELAPISAKETYKTAYNIELPDPIDIGTYPINVKIKYDDGEGGYVTDDVDVNLVISNCFDVEDQSIEEDDTTGITIDLADYVDDPILDDSDFTYDIENETNTELIDCTIDGSIITCANQAADQTGYSDIAVSVVYGDHVNYDTFTLTVEPKNDPPVAYDLSEEVDEDKSVVIELNCSDIDGDSLSYTADDPEHGTLSGSGSSRTYRPDDDYNGPDSFTYKCNDGKNDSNEATVDITVHPVLDPPSITSASPDYDPLIGDGVDQEFKVTVHNPDNAPIKIIWYVDGSKDGTGSPYTFNEAVGDTYEVIVKVTDAGETEVYDEEDWSVTVSEVPVTKDYTGTIRDVDPLNVDAFTDLTIIKNNVAKIDFGDQEIDLSDVIDIDPNVIIENGVVGINSDAPGFNVFKNTPATITMYGVTSPVIPPIIYYNKGFTVSGIDVCDENSNPWCVVLDYNPTTGTLVFDVSHFTIFFLTPPTAPIADAGPDQNVAVNTLVTLDGSASTDDGTIVSYTWTQTSGDNVTINNANNDIATFTPTITGTYEFRLTVTDNDAISDKDEVTINVEEAPPTPPPIITGNLTISDLDIKVGDDSDKDIHEKYETDYKIKEKAKPGDKVKFDIEVESIFPSSSDIEIDDINIEITISDIDDGDDLEEDKDIDKDLDPGDDDSVTIEFEVPLLVKDDIYDVEIFIDAEDEKGNDHDIRWELTLEVKKDKHEIIIDEADLSPSLIRCNRNPALDIKVVNIGREDEDDITIEIKNAELDIDIEEKDIELEEGDDEDSVFDKTYRLKIDDDVKAGTYPITVKAYYDSKTGDEETPYLTVEKCVEKVITPLEQEPVDIITTTPPTIEPVEPPVTKISFRDTTEYLTLLAILFIILLGGVIFLIGATIIMIRKR